MWAKFAYAKIKPQRRIEPGISRFGAKRYYQLTCNVLTACKSTIYTKQIFTHMRQRAQVSLKFSDMLSASDAPSGAATNAAATARPAANTAPAAAATTATVAVAAPAALLTLSRRAVVGLLADRARQQRRRHSHWMQPPRPRLPTQCRLPARQRVLNGCASERGCMSRLRARRVRDRGSWRDARDWHGAPLL